MSKSRLLIILLFLVCILIWLGVWQESSRLLEVIFFDVGSGDATLIVLPRGGTILIDGGETGKGERVILPYLRKRGIRKLDTVILTNADSNHIGGLIEILSKLRVGLVLRSGQEEAGELYQEFLDLVSGDNIRCKAVRRGQELHGFSGVSLEFLNPPYYLYEETQSDMNNNSVVLRLGYGKVQFLFCSDVEQDAEEDMVDLYRRRLKANVIKVPCRGSEGSSSWNFISQVNPDIAIISVGRNERLGYPNPITLKKYEKLGSRIYRTDVSGAITISTDGENLDVNTMY